jgi:hypothetical protein
MPVEEFALWSSNPPANREVKASLYLWSVTFPLWSGEGFLALRKPPEQRTKFNLTERCASMALLRFAVTPCAVSLLQLQHEGNSTNFSDEARKLLNQSGNREYNSLNSVWR